jgi:SAM-dependent methyltransferase
MKRLTELVKTREYLQEVYDTSPIANTVSALESRLLAHITPVDSVQKDVAQLANDLGRIYSDLEFNRDRFNLVVDRLGQEIQAESTKFFSDNYSLELHVESEAIGNIRKVRVMDLSSVIRTEIQSRIQLHTSWQYPALEIGCRDGEWTQHLVAADPLYITDQYRDFITATKELFTPEYQQRLRSYLISGADMGVLPQGQMAFVFCWNFLNYRSLDTVKEYLKSVKELLRPGGVFMFSYNNGDMHECAGYSEGFWMSYIPKSMLVPMCESLGFEVIHTRDSRGEGTAISWIELKKSGTLETVKAHQVLGEIKRI